ncbi:MAG TPA: outer membrane protein assembly factor BamD [Steroidobacteraceae bacterium]
MLSIRLPLRGPAALLLAYLAACVGLAGCHARGAKDVPSVGPDILYERAHKSLVSQDYDNAIKIYEALAARFPFAEQARQGRLDILYAYYQRRESESAIDAAEQFIRENPTHPRIDYAWYIKGLVDFERIPGRFERTIGIEVTKHPPTTALKSFNSFRTLVDQYPKSEYAYDARLRMVYLRNRLAEFEVNVARYYVRRGAYVAAAQRAKQAIEQYDGAPAVRSALEIMISCYERLRLTELAKQSREVYQANFGATDAAGNATAPPPKKRHWYWPF